MLKPSCLQCQHPFKEERKPASTVKLMKVRVLSLSPRSGCSRFDLLQVYCCTYLPCQAGHPMQPDEDASALNQAEVPYHRAVGMIKQMHKQNFDAHAGNTSDVCVLFC